MIDKLNWTTGPAMGWNTDRGFTEKAKHGAGFYTVSKSLGGDEFTLTYTQRDDLSKRRSVGAFKSADDAKAAALKDIGVET